MVERVNVDVDLLLKLSGNVKGVDDQDVRGERNARRKKKSR
jgi:hypothetical protein